VDHDRIDNSGGKIDVEGGRAGNPATGVEADNTTDTPKE
jgi:hypothetical protein